VDWVEYGGLDGIRWIEWD